MLCDISVPVVVTRYAREQWWYNIENVGLTPYPQTTLQALEEVGGELFASRMDLESINALSKPDEMWNPEQEADAILSHVADESDRASRQCIAQLQEEIVGRQEGVIVVVTHCGIIKQLCGKMVENCEVVQLLVSEELPWRALSSKIIRRDIQEPQPTVVHAGGGGGVHGRARGAGLKTQGDGVQ